MTWTLRVHTNEITQTTIDLNTQGNRRSGRPAYTWRSQIEVEVNISRKSWGEVKALAQYIERC